MPLPLRLRVMGERRWSLRSPLWGIIGDADSRATRRSGIEGGSIASLTVAGSACATYSHDDTRTMARDDPHVGELPEGVQVGLTRVDFASRADPAAWHAVLHAIGIIDPTQSLPSDWSFEFGALPRVLAPGARFVSGVVHGMPSEPFQAHWALTLAPAPGPNPPDGLVTASARVGGTDGFFGRLAQAWPGPRVIDVSFVVTFLVTEAMWTSRLTPRGARKLGKAEHSGEVTAVLRRATHSWAIEPAVPVSEIIETGPAGFGWAGLTSRGSLQVAIDTNVFQTVEGASWKIVSKFVGRTRGRGARARTGPR